MEPYNPTHTYNSQTGWESDSTGIPVRKCFSYKTLKNTRITYRLWNPKLDNLPLLEEKRWAINKRNQKLFETEYRQITADVAAEIQKYGHFGGVHGKANIKFLNSDHPEAKDMVIAFIDTDEASGVAFTYTRTPTVTRSSKGSKGITPATVMNQNLVDRWFAFNKRRDALFTAIALFEDTFLMAAAKYIDDYVQQQGNVIHLRINNRDYWFEYAKQSNYGQPVISKLAYPETIVSKVVNNPNESIYPDSDGYPF